MPTQDSSASGSSIPDEYNVVIDPTQETAQENLRLKKELEEITDTGHHLEVRRFLESPYDPSKMWSGVERDEEDRKGQGRETKGGIGETKKPLSREIQYGKTGSK